LDNNTMNVDVPRGVGPGSGHGGKLWGMMPSFPQFMNCICM